MNTKRDSNRVITSASVLILDIEGTTSSISFVKDELFPYVRNNLEAYIEKNWDTEMFKDILKSLKNQAQEDEINKVDGLMKFPESEEKDILKKAIVGNVLWQMDNDRKTKSLKDFQGIIMEDGFKKGDLKGHVYDDVAPSLEEWCQQQKDVYIYSSGSVHAQKLLFGHSVKGDLLPYIKGHFDTSVGMKGDPASYKKILSEISCSPAEVAFFTDVPKEAKAAKEAGIFSVLLSRDGNLPLTVDETKEFPVINSFEEIEFENINKKRKICSETDVNNENKTVSKCDVVSLKEDGKPNDPKVTPNNDSEVMEVEESSEELQSKQIDDKSDTAEISQNSTEDCDKVGIIGDKVKNEALNKPAPTDLSTHCDNNEKENIESIEDKTPDVLQRAEKHFKTECQPDNVDNTPNSAENEKSDDIKDKSMELQETNEITGKSTINLDIAVDNEGVSKDATDIQCVENDISNKEGKDSQSPKRDSEMLVDNESNITSKGHDNIKLSENVTEVPEECDTKIKSETCEVTEIKETMNGIDHPQDISVDNMKHNVEQETCEVPTNKSNDGECSIKTNEIKVSNTVEINKESQPDKLSNDLKNETDVVKNCSEEISNENGIKNSISDSNPELVDIKEKEDSNEQVLEKCEEKECLISEAIKTGTDAEKAASTDSKDDKSGNNTTEAVETNADSVRPVANVDISTKTTELIKIDDNSKQPQSEKRENKISEVITNGKLSNENGSSSPVSNGASTEAKKINDSNESQINTVVEA